MLVLTCLTILYIFVVRLMIIIISSDNVYPLLLFAKAGRPYRQ
jgi:hypothetical protein